MPHLPLEMHWSRIQQVVARGQTSSIYCSVATVNPDGTPNVTPIGTVFLRDGQTGYFFDQYTTTMARNLEFNPNVCVMAVNANRVFWLRSFLFGRFTEPPGVRLYGKAGSLRPASTEELRGIEARVRPTKWLKGSKLLWGSFTHVRDIAFTSFRPVSYPVMTQGLWSDGDA